MTELIRGLYNLGDRNKGCVLTIGNFDGLHRGHQALIRVLRQQAERLKLPSCVMLFEPHPQEFFLGEKAPARLMSLCEKVKIFRELSVDRVCCLRFNQCLADMEAEAFIKEILVQRLGVHLVVIGDDFKFGRTRQGDFDRLKKCGQQYQFEVYRTKTELLSGQRIGSSRVRDAVERGNFVLASQLLMRPFTLSGRIIRGEQRGRLLGFPTANISLHRLILPLTGVFVVRVHGVGKKPLHGVANCGIRPTVDGLKKLLEVHLLDFYKNIYGCKLEIEFLERIRDERKFASLEALKEQITKDVSFATEYFTSKSYV